MQAAGFEHAGQQCYTYVLERAGIATFDWVALQLYEAFSRFLHDTTRAVPPESQAHAITTRAEALAGGFVVAMPTPRASSAYASLRGGQIAHHDITGAARRWDHLLTVARNCIVDMARRVGRFVDVVADQDREKVIEEAGSVEKPEGCTEASRRVQVPLQKLVVGVANGWADGEKFCRVGASELLAVRFCAATPRSAPFPCICLVFLECLVAVSYTHLTLPTNREV